MTSAADGVSSEASSSRPAGLAPSGVSDRAEASGRPRGNTASTLTSTTTVAPSQAGSTSTAKRKVRTVPPSAAFDPPTPPGESQPTFDTARRSVRPAAKHRRRRHFKQYWSSGEESCSSDADDSSDDDEPPWWTFTQRGVNKLRASIDRPARTPPTADLTEGESGRDSIREPDRHRRSVGMLFNTPSRQNSTETTPPGSRRASAASRLFHPRPFASTTSGLLRRVSDQGDAAISAAALASAVERTNSAPIGENTPGTPDDGDDDSTPTGMRSPGHQSAGEGTDPGPSRARRPSVGRFMTMPLHRPGHDHSDNLTDSEATMHASPRLRAKQRLFHLGALSGSVPEEDDNEAGSGANTPTHKSRRLNANNLRIRLPPPLTHHFSQGWPHAGSWQDALRNGNLDDGLKQPSRSNGMTISLPPPPDADELTAVSHHLNRSRPHSPERRKSIEFSHVSTPKRAKQKAKSRRSKSKRYRPAMVPPTPGMLSFTPGVGERIIGSETWGANVAPASDPNVNPFDRLNPFDRIDEEYTLSPQHSRLSEKSSSVGKSWGRRIGSRRKQWRRTLFLDARVTIYIRVLNLAISAILLALAITIRQQIGKLGLRGIIGPSTTLIISYACLTIVHGLTAMYREYFGRPIGLWGLRSKMLWVCLDLLFIALWASAATLAINDYISTPLDCTPSTPWWSAGNEYYTPSRATSTVGNANHIALWNGSANTLADTLVPDAIKFSPKARAVCRRQIGCFAVSIVALLLYCGNMVLSLFRIFETVRRTSNPGRQVSV